MMLMCGQSNQIWHFWAGKYPGRVGWILGPSNLKKQALRWWMPYALDNDAFIAWTKKTEWDVKAWREMLVKVRLLGIAPLWALVPDVVADRSATLENWKRYSPEVQALEWNCAFAVQDGMVPEDVPGDAHIIFVGGTTEWKWRTLPTWAASFRRVHVGRVNSLDKLWLCDDLGVESVDGTGWFRDGMNGKRIEHIGLWLSGMRGDATE